MPRQKFEHSCLPPAPDLQYEIQLWSAGFEWIAGIDEAGRGALAGPVSAGVVILPKEFIIPQSLVGVHDSKKLTPNQRIKFSLIIREHAADYAIGFASNGEIDMLGIISATHLAISRALQSLRLEPNHLLLDYINLKELPLEQTSLVKGDCRVLSIACASILAKVYRDDLMVQYSSEYPDYGFEAHKGYGTEAHRRALVQFGPCPIHRRSFSVKLPA